VGTVTTPAPIACIDCQVDYQGAATYPVDECSDEAGTDAPPEINFGFVFTSPTSWEVWSGDAAGTYGAVGTATFNGTSYVLTRTDPVDAPVIGDVGDLTTTLIFTP
jgi:hypothetical protein